MNIKNRIEDTLPGAIEVFMNRLPGEEAQQLHKISPELFAKIYQAGAIYAINMMAGELKEQDDDTTL